MPRHCHFLPLIPLTGLIPRTRLTGERRVSHRRRPFYHSSRQHSLEPAAIYSLAIYSLAIYSLAIYSLAIYYLARFRSRVAITIVCSCLIGRDPGQTPTAPASITLFVFLSTRPRPGSDPARSQKSYRRKTVQRSQPGASCQQIVMKVPIGIVSQAEECNDGNSPEEALRQSGCLPLRLTSHTKSHLIHGQGIAARSAWPPQHFRSFPKVTRWPCDCRQKFGVFLVSCRLFACLLVRPQ